MQKHWPQELSYPHRFRKAPEGAPASLNASRIVAGAWHVANDHQSPHIGVWRMAWEICAKVHWWKGEISIWSTKRLWTKWTIYLATQKASVFIISSLPQESDALFSGKSVKFVVRPFLWLTAVFSFWLHFPQYWSNHWILFPSTRWIMSCLSNKDTYQHVKTWAKTSYIILPPRCLQLSWQLACPKSSIPKNSPKHRNYPRFNQISNSSNFWVLQWLQCGKSLCVVLIILSNEAPMPKSCGGWIFLFLNFLRMAAFLPPKPSKMMRWIWIYHKYRGGALPKHCSSGFSKLIGVLFMKMNRWFTHCETGFWQTRNDIHYINNDMDDCGGSLQKIPSFATTSQSGVPYQFPNHLRWSGRPSITATKNGKVNKTYQEKQEVRKIQNSNINKLLLCCLIWILLNLDVHLLTMAIWRHFGSYSKHLASQPFVDWILDLRLTRAKV